MATIIKQPTSLRLTPPAPHCATRSTPASNQTKKKKKVKKKPQKTSQSHWNPHNPPTHTHNYRYHRPTPTITITVALSSTKKPKKQTSRIKNGSKPTYQDRCLALSNKIDASGLPLCNNEKQRQAINDQTMRNPLINPIQPETHWSTQFNLKTTRNKERKRKKERAVAMVIGGCGDRRLMEAWGRKIYEIRERESCEFERIDLMKWEKESEVRVRGTERREKQILKY